jgi:hypothetical protein
MKRKIKLFISHASEDKVPFVEALVSRLQEREYDVWYDKLVLLVGDSLRAKIDQGLKESDYGVVVFSPHFFSSDKKWTAAEVAGLFSLEDANRKMILPIWLNVGGKEVKTYSPMLSDRIGAPAPNGVADLDSVVLSLEASIAGAEKQKSFDQIDPADEAIDRVVTEVASTELNNRMCNSLAGAQTYVETVEFIEASIAKKFEGKAQFSCEREGMHFVVRGPEGTFMEVIGRKGMFKDSITDVIFEFRIFSIEKGGRATETSGVGFKWKPYFVSDSEVCFRETRTGTRASASTVFAEGIRIFCDTIVARSQRNR